MTDVTAGGSGSQPAAVPLAAVRQLAAILPPGMARAVVDTAVRELAARAKRDGSPRLAPGIAELLAALDSSEFGTAFTRMESPSQVTADVAARLTGTSPRYVRHLAASGRIRARKHGWTWEIDPASAAEYGRERGHHASDDTG